jgi:putative ABC transport system permease protein
VRQILEITLMNLRSLRYRVATSLVICVGIGGVVAVLVTVLAMATGLQKAVGDSGREDRALVMRDGAVAEAFSSISREAVLAIETAPGIRVAEDGSKSISPEVVLTVMLPKHEDDLNGAVPVRGLTPSAARVRSEFVLSNGRYFQPGLHEVIVGRSAQTTFRGLETGDLVHFHNADWQVVGVFESNRDMHESELLTDAATLMSAGNRSVFNAVTVTLDSPDSLSAFKEALEDDPRLKIEVHRESEYYNERSKQVSQLLFFVAYVVGSIMALGALFGAMNTMYSAVSVRTVEIATLRAIGFGATPVLISVLIEALGLAVLGALIGVAVAWLLFNGGELSLGGGFGQVAMQLDVGAGQLATGVIWACAVGFLGGLFPALRAARLSVAAGLRVIV